VLIDELRDMYSAEKQLVKVPPKLAKGAKDSVLKQLFKEHFEETKGQVLRLKKVFNFSRRNPPANIAMEWKGSSRRVPMHSKKTRKAHLLIRV
jgi:ferritin-like metal-binding protein YciE